MLVQGSRLAGRGRTGATSGRRASAVRELEVLQSWPRWIFTRGCAGFLKFLSFELSQIRKGLWEIDIGFPVLSHAVCSVPVSGSAEGRDGERVT